MKKLFGWPMIMAAIAVGWLALAIVKGVRCLQYLQYPGGPESWDALGMAAYVILAAMYAHKAFRLWTGGDE